MEPILILLVFIAAFLAAFIMASNKELVKFVLILFLMFVCIGIGTIIPTIKDKQYEQINQEQDQDSTSENEQGKRNYYRPRKWHGV